MIEWPSGDGVPSRTEFVERVWERGRELYRDLPWRNTRDPYAVLVSEIMLQQTQVLRVMRYWERFTAAFPTIDALASATTGDVLEMWQGLGYNRRALSLKRAADICSQRWSGRLPTKVDDLMALPGVGPATAAGVMAFAYGQPAVYVETNVRAVFLHELFPGRDKVSDRQLIPLVEATCPGVVVTGVVVTGAVEADVVVTGAVETEAAAAATGDDVRAWYYALLDYGAYLKKAGVNPSRRSAHYARQSEFEGSRRQKRAWIVRRVLAEPEGVPDGAVLADLNEAERAGGRGGVDRLLFDSIVDDLVREGFFRRVDGVLLP